MRVPMRSTGADQPVVVKKSRNGDGAKGLDRSALRIGQLRGSEEEPTSKAKPFGDRRLVDKSRMNREVHVRFREDVGV